MIRKEKADLIAAQSLNEIVESRTYKKGKISTWQDNESMYYVKKLTQPESRANVALGQMQEFVHTLLSKIDNPLVFKFTKRKNSQLKRVELLNALRKTDSDLDDWDLKDIVGKKQGIIYGRAIYAYYASSDGGYKAHLEPVDVYDFLIDPSVSGIDMETAMYMGRWGVVKTTAQLKQGIKDKLYHAANTRDLLERGGNSETNNQEEINKKPRSYDQGTTTEQDVQNANKYKFWEWVTTYEGERYYILMDNNGKWIRCELLKDMFSSGLFPFWSWAAFPDLTEFWTPSYCDYAREIFQAQEVSINQMLDNAEAVNKPQKLVAVGDIEDMTKVVKYRKDGIIPVKKGVDVSKAIQFVKTPSINTPLQVYEALGGIQDRASGVTSGSSGVADESGKVGIYEGNQAAAADRFGLLNKSYSFGYKSFARLYESGVKDHLIKKVAVDILGPDGVEVKRVNKRDLFKKGDEFGLIVEASDAEIVNSIRNQKSKLAFLNAQINNELINKKKAFEMGAKISGLNEDEIRELLDVNSYGNEKLMSEADRDIEALLDGERIELNAMANNAYKQKLINYVRDNKENISDKQFSEISLYISALEPIIMRNEARRLQTDVSKSLDNQVNPQGQEQLKIANLNELNNTTKEEVV